MEGISTERERAVRRHRARQLLERRPAVDVLRRRARAPGVLRGACGAARRTAIRPGQPRDHPEPGLGRSRRLRRHGGMRDPRRRPVPGQPTRDHHGLAGVAHAAIAGDHHVRRGRLRPRAPGPASGDPRARLGARARRLHVARPLHPLQPAAHDRGRARTRDAHPQRPLRAADQRRVRPGADGSRRRGRPPPPPPRSS